MVLAVDEIAVTMEHHLSESRSGVHCNKNVNNYNPEAVMVDR